MDKFQLYITDRQREALNHEAESLGISVAELIRRILDEYLTNGGE